MVPIDQLDLPHLAMEEHWFAENPYPHFAVARAQHPWLATSSFGYVLTSYTAVRTLCAINRMRTAYDHLVDFMGARNTPWGRFQEGHMLGKNGDAHKRVRDILAPAFTPRQADQHRPLMREVISTLLDEWAPKGAFDFEEFASCFPVTVMCKLLGASPDVLPGIRSSLEAMALSVSMDPGLLEQLQPAVVHLDEFAHQLMTEREQRQSTQGLPDLLDILIKAKADGGMSEQELADLLIFLFAAGFDTSKNILTLTMHEMIKHPEIYERCGEDIQFCRKVIDESMRFHSVTTTNRILTDDIEYSGVLLPKGTNLWFPWSVIARDPEAADNPDEFNPDRIQENRHLGFALGAHMCLGQFIARAQLEEGLHQIAQRITRPTSPGPLGWRPFPGVWGICGLPIKFEPATVQQ